MVVEVTYKGKHGDWDGETFNFEENTTEDEIIETVNNYIGPQFGHSRIEIKIDGVKINE